MNRSTGLILTLTVGVLAAPATALAQCDTGNNMWTRSAGLYLDRAHTNPRPEEKRDLFQQALETATESTQKDAGNAKGWFLLGQANLKLGNYEAADAAFDQVEKLCGGEYEGLGRERLNAWIMAYNAGVGLLQRGDLEGAIEQMNRADVIYQGRPGARLTLGSILARQGKYDEAAAAYRGALEILRGPARAELDEKGEAEWAEQEEIAAFNLAQILAGAGKDEEAIAAYRDFLEREPDNVTAKTNLAVVLARTGQAEESAKLYEELLARTDLTDEDYFQVGIGLFRAEKYEQAADAFRRSLELNPYSRDALYNLSQALYVQGADLEKAKETAAAADKPQIDTDLSAKYEELRQVTEKLVAVDPYNRNTYALLARAYRGLADLSSDKAAGDALRNKALEALKTYEAMPFQVTQVEMAPSEGKVEVSGQLENLKLTAGQPVTLQITLVGEDGQPVAEQEVTVAAPEPEQSTEFEATIEVTEDVVGWRYAVVE